MARISELHYSNAYARSSGVDEFVEVALTPDEAPLNYLVSFYQSDGTVGVEIPLTHPAVVVTTDLDSGETAYVISAGSFPILLTDPNGTGADNYEAFALTNATTGTVQDFYDIGGGTKNIPALDGAAIGAVSVSLPVLTGPNATTTSLQFNRPAPDTLVHEAVDAGDTGIACFASGTRIRTDVGYRLVDTLHEGDMIWTRDNGFQPVCWIGQRKVSGQGRFAPVQFSPDTFGALRPHLVSQNHRILVQGWRAQLVFGEDELLVPAKALVDDCDVRISESEDITYFHLLFEEHQIICGDGVLSESFYPGAEALKGAAATARSEMFALFPELINGLRFYGDLARPVLPARLGPLMVRN